LRARWLCYGREALSYDVVIVGAGLAAAIRLKQLCRDADADLSVCVLEKDSEVGAPSLTATPCFFFFEEFTANPCYFGKRRSVLLVRCM
jgi:choline dehydrogenase-like flavoprotein